MRSRVVTMLISANGRMSRPDKFCRGESNSVGLDFGLAGGMEEGNIVILWIEIGEREVPTGFTADLTGILEGNRES